MTPWQAPARLRGFLRDLGPLPSIPELDQAETMQKASFRQDGALSVMPNALLRYLTSGV